MIAPWTRNERGATAGLKTISYAANVRALAYAEARGASEAIFANTQGNLCEATGSNVFLVLEGTLVTPPPTAGCLLGVTRGLLLELCGTCEERDVPVEALAAARRGVPLVDDARSPTDRARRRDGVARCARPGREGARRRVPRARRARSRSLARRARWITSAGRDRGLGSVVGPHDEMSVAVSETASAS